MAQRVMIENFEVEKFLGNLLATHPVAAHYTLIVHLFKKEDTLVSQKYIWAHSNMRPWGHWLPSQCEVCFCFRSYSDRRKGKASGNTGKFMDYMDCNGYKCNRAKCTEIIEFVQPSSHVKVSGASDWLVSKWP
jgi:hypothetical protein